MSLQMLSRAVRTGHCGHHSFMGLPGVRAADFSKETMQDKRTWQKIFKVMKTQDLQPRILYPAKVSFRVEGQIVSQTKIKDYINTKPVLQEMLEGLL